MEYDIRYTETGDFPSLNRWLQSPGMLHWFPMSTEKEIKEMINAWVLFARYRAALTLTVNDEPIGMGVLFLMPYKKVAHHCLSSLIIDPDHQHKGYGTALLKNLKHLAQTRFTLLEEMHFEVFGESPLIPILKKMGFTEMIYQEDYIKEGDNYFPRRVLIADLTQDKK